MLVTPVPNNSGANVYLPTVLGCNGFLSPCMRSINPLQKDSHLYDLESAYGDVHGCRNRRIRPRLSPVATALLGCSELSVVSMLIT